jgi:drug/metabolite transporter (DMT)-like permease
MEPTARAPAGAEPDILKLLTAFAIIHLVWGSTFLAIRFAVETLPPLLMMGSRHLLAGILLLAWLRMRGHAWPEPRLWRSALLAGSFCFLGCHGLLGWAELYVPSGLAALLAASLPIWMVLLAPLGGQESELRPKVLAGIALGIAGVAILTPLHFGAQQRQGWGALAIIAGELLWAIGAIYSRGVKTRTPVSVFAAMQMVCGGALLCLTGLGVGEASRLTPASFTARSVLSLAFLVVFGSILAFSAYTWLLQVSSPAIVSTHSYVNPLVAVFLGWAAAGEQFTVRTMVGTVVILASVALVSIRKERRAVGPAVRKAAC